MRAVDLAIRTTEFDRQVLGGRTRVFVLDDVHRLMSSTIVLKPALLTAAQTEMASTRAFAKFIGERGLGERFQLPIPLAVKAVDAVNAIYAMERTRGETLADRLRGMSHRGALAAVTGYFQSALEFLAAYQAWRLEGSAPTELGGFDLEVSDSAKALGVSRAAPDDFFELASRCIPDRVSLLPKKDAHPGNWLVLDSGLAMIDLEATAFRPLCYEVAQLIDDHPAIELSDAGFQARTELVEHYVAQFRKFTVPSALAGDAKSLYPFCWVLRCAHGVGYCHRNYRSAEPKERAVLQARRNHYEASLDFMANRFGDGPVGLFASKVRLLASQVV